MGVSENEIGLREGRARFGDLVNRAEYAGEITYITRHGRRVAAIVPINRVAPQEQAMTRQDITAAVKTTLGDNPETFDIDGIVEEIGSTYGWDIASIDDVPSDEYWQIVAQHDNAPQVSLYETNSDLLVIARGGNAWTLHPGDDLLGQFAAHAAAWINGDWAPNEGDGQTRADLDGLKEVATWNQEDGLSLKVRRDSLGGAACDYIGNTITLVSATSGDSMPEGAKELAESDIDWDDLPEDAQAWATEQGYGDDADELLYIVSGEVHIDGWPTRTIHL